MQTYRLSAATHEAAARFSLRCRESLETNSQQLAIRPGRLPSRDENGRAVRILQEFQHRSVVLVEEPRVNLKLVVRRNSDQVLVVRTVVDRPETQAVAHRWLASDLGVSDDMRCVEESCLLETADRALVRVRREDRARNRAWCMRTRVSRTAYRRSIGSTGSNGSRSSKGPTMRPRVKVTRRLAGSSAVTKTGHSGRYQPGRVPMKYASGTCRSQGARSALLSG
jgi:hypothetical protein